MSKTVIKIENLSKIYRLGEVGTGTISHDLNRWWKMNVLGHDDPYAKIGHVNDRTAKAEKGEMVAALRDINLEVKEGEVLGIIGKNGAGKSTLLKILSRVTSPTTGSVKVSGRMASLLEVGTGFHPDMTGRENIYMNGTIMGMRKWEITRKLDEIVEFAGVAKYLDTPTKRYSSGMTVRLGFAIAAHLEPEILIVDEVLAVGDAEFQKKAIGKMQDVSANDGRTVLFVSHNMGAIKTLCSDSVWMQHGTIKAKDITTKIVNEYLDYSDKIDDSIEKYISKCGRIELKKPYWIDYNGKKTKSYAIGEEIALCFEIQLNEPIKTINPGFAVESKQGYRIFTSHQKDNQNQEFNSLETGKYTIISKFNINSLAPGVYTIPFGIRDENETTIILGKNDLELIIESSKTKNAADGILWHTTEWEIKKE